MAGAAAATPLDSYRETWRRKAVLRALYADYYRRMANLLKPGPTLELGAGSGQLREHVRDAVLTDIQSAPWLDGTADAQALPFRMPASTILSSSTSSTMWKIHRCFLPRRRGCCARADGLLCSSRQLHR